LEEKGFKPTKKRYRRKVNVAELHWCHFIWVKRQLGQELYGCKLRLAPLKLGQTWMSLT